MAKKQLNFVYSHVNLFFKLSLRRKSLFNIRTRYKSKGISRNERERERKSILRKGNSRAPSPRDNCDDPRLPNEARDPIV